MAMAPQQQLNAWRRELAVTAKNGLNFILAASLSWAAIAYVWTLPLPPARLSFITFFVGPAMLPLAWLLSKVLRTTWIVPYNPLQPLGLWLNVAQLLYFPFLIFIYSKHPAYFLMTYGIITGAHFFPYAWFYNTKAYAIMAGVIAVGCLSIGVRTAATAPYWVAVFMAGALLVLSALLLGSYYQHKKEYSPAALPA
jgi:hypothetical protein